MSTARFEGGSPTYNAEETAYLEMQNNRDFQDLRRRYRGWVIPVAVASLVWYFLYVLLAAYAPGFYATKVLGNINVGLIAGLLQFVSTFGITALYIRFADKTLDPVSSRIRDQFEGGRR